MTEKLHPQSSEQQDVLAQMNAERAAAVAEAGIVDGPYSLTGDQLVDAKEVVPVSNVAQKHFARLHRLNNDGKAHGNDAPTVVGIPKVTDDTPTVVGIPKVGDAYPKDYGVFSSGLLWTKGYRGKGDIDRSFGTTYEAKRKEAHLLKGRLGFLLRAVRSTRNPKQ